MDHLDRFKNSEFPFVREMARGLEQDFKEAIFLPNDILPDHLQTHDEWHLDDRPGRCGKFYGTSIAEIERRQQTQQPQSPSAKADPQETREARIEKYTRRVEETGGVWEE